MLFYRNPVSIIFPFEKAAPPGKLILIGDWKTKKTSFDPNSGRKSESILIIRYLMQKIYAKILSINEFSPKNCGITNHFLKFYNPFILFKKQTPIIFNITWVPSLHFFLLSVFISTNNVLTIPGGLNLSVRKPECCFWMVDKSELLRRTRFPHKYWQRLSQISPGLFPFHSMSKCCSQLASAPCFWGMKNSRVSSFNLSPNNFYFN